MTSNHPTACEQCEQLFGSFDRYLLPAEVVLRSARNSKNPVSGIRDIPAMAECYPCEDTKGFVVSKVFQAMVDSVALHFLGTERVSICCPGPYDPYVLHFSNPSNFGSIHQISGV